MKFIFLFATLSLLPTTTWAEDIGFSYQSSDGTIYTSTTAPAFCKKYYDSKHPTHAAGTMPHACTDPQFTTSRGSLPKRQPIVDNDEGGSRRKGGKKWWDVRTWGNDDSEDEVKLVEKEDHEYKDGKKAGRIEGRLPPAPGPRSRSRQRVEKEETIVLERVDENEDGEDTGKKAKRPVGKIPPKPIVVENDGNDGRDGEDGDDDFEGKGKKGGRITVRRPVPPRPIPVVVERDPSEDGKKGGKISGRNPPRPPMPIPDGDDDQGDGKKGGRIGGKKPVPPMPIPGVDENEGNGKKEVRITGRKPVEPKRQPIPLPKRKPVIVQEDDGDGKKGGKITGRLPPAPPVVEDEGDDDDFEQPGKKGGKVSGRVPPPPPGMKGKEAGRIKPILPPAPKRIVNRGDEDLDIEALRARLQPLTITPPRGKVRPLKGNPDSITVITGPDNCDDGRTPAEVIPNSRTIKELNRKLTERNPIVLGAGDPALLAAIRKRTPEQEKCAAEAPAKPTRAVLAFDSFNSFDYVEYYKQKGADLPEKEAQAFQSGQAFSEATRKEDRSAKGVFWKYYDKESESKEELSPAVRCAFELATKQYKDKSGKPVYHTITLVGHSFGGNATYKVAAMLKRLGVRVDLVLTTDPRQPVSAASRDNFSRPQSVDRWVNFFQRNDPVLKGFPVDGAENVDISETGVWHGQAAHTDQVRKRASDEVSALPACKGSLSTSVYKQSRANCE